LTNTLRRETEWLRRGAKARQTKQTARLDAAQDLKQTVQDLQKKNLHQKVKIDFGEIEKSPQKLIEAKQISKSYGSKKLFADLDVLIRRKSRLAILGDNGTGKSTLIQILLKKQDPDSGSVFHADGLKIAYFEQSRETIDPNASVLKNVCPQGDYVSFQGKFIHVRSYLDKFLFFGHQSELPAHRLSGGEKARLRLAQLMLIEAQVLVLDEPTNDLDSDTLNVLEEALNEFPGALILVTHDRFFLDSVADELLAFPKPGSSDPQLLRFSDYWQWENWFQENPSDSVTSPPFSTAGKDQGASSGPKVRLSYKEKLELENMESSILKLETEQKRLEELSQLSSASSDNKKLQEISKELAQVAVKIEEQYQRWSELSAKSLGT
jgi:ATP-binding cassette subfamily F protein uup